MDETTSVKICCVKGCAEPRMRRANGTYHSRCTAHMREYWNKSAHGELARRKKKNVCLVEGCDEERHRSKGGFVYQYCEAHQKAHSTNQNRKNTEKRNGQKPLTEAQQHAGFDRDERKVALKSSDFKLCIINYDEDTMTFVEGKVTRRCKTDMLALLPGGWQILLDGHAEDGYFIVERGTPPPLADLDARYDWSD